jgi:hypothetical protein
MLPEHVKVRIPELLHCSMEDGFNLKALYRKSIVYKNDYKFSLIIVQSKEGNVFGAFVDDVLR